MEPINTGVFQLSPWLTDSDRTTGSAEVTVDPLGQAVARLSMSMPAGFGHDEFLWQRCAWIRANRIESRVEFIGDDEGVGVGIIEEWPYMDDTAEFVEFQPEVDISADELFAAFAAMIEVAIELHVEALSESIVNEFEDDIDFNEALSRGRWVPPPELVER